MFMAGIPDLRDQLGNQPAMIDRLWLQPLFLAAFDLFQIRLYKDISSPTMVCCWRRAFTLP